MKKNLEPHFSLNNDGSQLVGESLEDIRMYNFEAFKNLSRKDNTQSLIDGITIRNRQTLDKVSSLILNSSSVKLYSSKAYKNILKAFCNRLLKMGIDASFYDINEDKNNITFSLNDLAIVNNFKSEKELCDRVLRTAKLKYAKTVSISESTVESSYSDYNIVCKISLKDADENKMVESALNCLSFTTFSKSMLH